MPTYTGQTLDPPQLDSAEIIATSVEPLLRFEHYTSQPARVPSHKVTVHNLLIPVQSSPLQAKCVRGGQSHEIVLNSGDIALTPAGTEVSWQWHEPVEVILVWIDPVVLHDFVQEELKILVFASTIAKQLIIHDLDLLAAAKMMKSSLETPELGQSTMFDALCRVFLTTLVQKYRVRDEINEVAISEKLSVPRYRAIVDFVDSNIERSISPAEISKVAGVSASSLNRLFRSTLEKSPSQFVANYRLQRARALINNTTIPLSKVAMDCGFADQAHLSRLFKKNFGMTPSAYRHFER